MNTPTLDICKSPGDVQVTFDPSEHPHRRFNPLRGEHVLVSPHRTKRPWKGQTDPPVLAELPEHDPECYLCPGNERSGGFVNPDYTSTFTFPNDYPALLPDALPTMPSSTTCSSDDMFTSTPVRGSCKVMCFHPRHDLTLARMDVQDIVKIVGEWTRVYEEEGTFLRESGRSEAGADEGVGYVQIFENRGAMMGASAPHPHGQVWSLSYIPDEPASELYNMSIHSTTASPPPGHHPLTLNGKPHILLSYAAEEVERKERIVEIDEEGGWLAVVPFWATWPFEVMILPFRRHIPSLSQLTSDEVDGLARILKKVLVRYDNLFSCPFPYSFGLHQAPLPPLIPANSVAQIHFHFYPPLLRSASVRKFLVGFEMMGEAQRDLTPEQAAGRLRAVRGKHYLDNKDQ